jgi:acyl carrier protein
VEVTVADEDEVLDALADATGLQRSELASNYSLLDLGLTSYRIMQALMQIEETFGVEFSEDEVVRFPAIPARALGGLVGERIATTAP